MNNKFLNNAKKNQKNEFYTQICDIENELKYYTEHFNNKVIYCNCDNPEWSNFWLYFYNNFHSLKLNKLISTHYEENTSSYKLEYDGKHITKTILQGNGSFESEECIGILKEADIVCSNPPFTMSQTYLLQLIKYQKQFIIISHQNAMKYKDVFPLIVENKIHIPVITTMAFRIPDTYEITTENIKYDEHNNPLIKIAGICWYTNIPIPCRNEPMILTETYTPDKYPKYDNYDAINISKIKDIPMDYTDVMGVPISFMGRYNPEQFEIIGELNHGCDNKYDFAKPILNGRELFPRILIKKKIN